MIPLVILLTCLVIIGYVYVGYPLLVTLLAQLRQKPSFAVPETWPEVTLLIAAYNETAVIAQKLKNSLALDYPSDKLHILVAADGSSDGTEDVVRQFKSQGVQLSYRPERQGKMAAINRAMPQAKGEIVVFSDANNMYAPDTLKALIRPFTHPKVGATTGAKHILKDSNALGQSEGLYWKYESWIKKQETRLGNCTAVAGEIIAIRRALVQSPPNHIINDDFYMGMQVIRQGHRLVYVPDAKSFEPVSLTAQDEVSRRARIVAGRYQAIALAHHFLPLHQPLTIWQIISHKFLRPLVPMAMIGALTANVWLLFSNFTASQAVSLAVSGLFWGQLLFYGTAFLGSQISKTNPLNKLFYVPTFLVQSNLAALVGLYRHLAGTQTTLWQRAARQLPQSES